MHPSPSHPIRTSRPSVPTQRTGAELPASHSLDAPGCPLATPALPARCSPLRPLFARPERFSLQHSERLQRRIFGRGGAVVPKGLYLVTPLAECVIAARRGDVPSMTNILASHLRGPAPDGQMTDVQI